MCDFFKPFHKFKQLNFLYDQKRFYSYQEIANLIDERALNLSRQQTTIKELIVPVETENQFNFIIDIFAYWKIKKIILPLSKSSQLNSSMVTECQEIKSAAIVMMTSGSQGHPKFIVHSYESLFYSAMGSIEFYDMKSEEIFPLTLSPHHIGGLMIILRAFFSGGIIHLSASNWKDLLSQKYDYVSLVPKQLKDILQDEELIKNAKQAKTLILGGAKLQLYEFNQALNKDLPLSLSYGQTETCAQVMATKAGDEKYSLGVVLPYRNVTITDQDQIEIAGSTLYMGEIINNKFIPFTNEKYYPQDKAILNNQREIIAIERVDDIINSGGKKVSPKEIRDYISDHYQIQDIEVFKYFDATWGEIPLVALESNNETHDKIVFDQLEKYKWPKFVKTFSNFPIKGIKTDNQKLKRSLCLSYIEKISNFKFSYQEKDINKTSPLLIYLHGFMGNKKDQFFDQINYDILSFDLPGHGQTGCHLFKDYNDIIRQLLQVFILLSSEEIIFYGYSMGGRILSSCVQTLTEINPKHKFFFESTHLGLQSSSEKEKRLTHDKNISCQIEKIPTLDEYKKFLNSWYDQAVFKDIKKIHHYQKFLLKKCDSLSLAEIQDFSKGLTMMSLGHQENQQSLIQHKNCYFLIGDLDNKFKNYYLELFKDLTNQDHLIIIEDASHNIHLGHLNAIHNALKDFLYFTS